MVYNAEDGVINPVILEMSEVGKQKQQRTSP